MDICKVYKRENFTVVSNCHLTDNRLTLKAIGLMTKILSLPDDWDLTIKGLITICNDGRTAIASAMKELENYGYVCREQLRNERGQICGYEYSIYEFPDMNPNFDGELPAMCQKPTEAVYQRDNTKKGAVKKSYQKPSAKKEQKTTKVSKKTPESENLILDKKDKSPESGFPISGKPITEKPNSENRHQINTNKINTNQSSTKSINQSIKEPSYKQKDGLTDGLTEPLEQQKAIESHIKTQVGYELFKTKADQLDEQLQSDEIDLYTYEEEIAQYDIHTLDTVIEAMVHHIMSESTTPVKIGTDFVGRAMLKSKLMKTDFTTMRHVVKTLYTNKNIKNKKHYAISMLYNA